MVVRLVEQHRRAGVTYPPGVLLEVRSDEAMVLMQAGIAVPCVDALARETRTA